MNIPPIPNNKHYIFFRQRCELRKCIYRNKKEQDKHRKKEQEHMRQVQGEGNCDVESQQVNLSESVNEEELDNSSNVVSPSSTSSTSPFSTFLTPTS